MTSVKTNKTALRVFSFILAIVSLFSVFSVNATNAYAAKKTPIKAYIAVRSAYGSSFPLTTNDRKQGKKRIMGVKTSLCSSYYAASKIKGSSSSQCEYAIFICKAKTRAKAKRVKRALKTYISNEKQSMYNYLSSTGKSIFANAKVGRIGKRFVYMVMIDTSSNTKAINAIKRVLA